MRKSSSESKSFQKPLLLKEIEERERERKRELSHELIMTIEYKYYR